MGLSGSFSPARVLRMDRQTISTASSWPTTRFVISSPMCISFSDSACARRNTGMPVMLEITWAISSSVTATTSSRTVCSHSCRFASSCSFSFRSWSRSFAASSNCWLLAAAFFCRVTSSISSSSSLISSGGFSRASRTRDPVSSITSIALSGRCLSLIYRSAIVTAFSIASSV